MRLSVVVVNVVVLVSGTLLVVWRMGALLRLDLNRPRSWKRNPILCSLAPPWYTQQYSTTPGALMAQH